MKKINIPLIVVMLVVMMTVATSPSQMAPSPIEGLGDYLTFWSGHLRIFALDDDVEVTMYDIATGLPLDFSDPRIDSTNFLTNPFRLEKIGDAFEGKGGLSETRTAEEEIQVRIKATDPADGSPKPILVWTGALAKRLLHPQDTPAMGQNPWMSYLPGLPPEGIEVPVSRELGRKFLGFTSRELYIFARKGDEPTSIVIEDLITNTDPDDDDSQTLVRADAVYADDEIEIYYLDQFEDDTITIVSSVDISVLAGIASQVQDDWAATPPSYALGDDGSEKGTLFYAFVNESLTVFPLEDDTKVIITDLSDGDDSKTFTLANGDVSGDYDFYTPVVSSETAGDLLPRAASPAVTIVTNNGNAFDRDFVKVEADKPILLYVGPIVSDVNEFADMAYAVPTGPESRIVYTYAQDFGGSNDLQIFGLDPDTVVKITSLARTEDMNIPENLHKFHDFLIGPGFGDWETHWRKGTADGGVWWGATIWNGEALRIESNKPIVVLSGDYDVPHFGAFAPYFGTAGPPPPVLPPVADCRPDEQDAALGAMVDFYGSASFDQDARQGALQAIFEWDHDLAVDSDGDGDPTNDVDGTGPETSVLHQTPVQQLVQLTYTDDEGQQAQDVCKINTIGGSIKIGKIADDDTTVFDFAFNAEPFALKNGEWTLFGGLDAGTYTVAETVPPRWLLAKIECDNGTTLLNPASPRVVIDLAPDEHVTCTFTNEENLPTITVVKEVKGIDDNTTSFDFTFVDEDFSLTNGESKLFEDLIAGTYTITETVPDRWLLAEIKCDNGYVESNPDAPQVTVDLDWAEDIVCTFTNEIPTAVELISFTADAGAGQVTLYWRTVSEIDSEGFNIWRSQRDSGPFTLHNDRLIPARGNADTGASYEFTDTGVELGVIYHYKLEEVDVHGVGTLYGPVSATPD